MPITESAPLAQVAKEAEELYYMFDLTNHNLGMRALKLAAEGVRECFQNQEDPQGRPWDELSLNYAAWKQVAVGNQPIGYLYGIMSDMAQIEGVKVIAPEYASMTYGLDSAAQIEATKFQEGGAVTGTNQPPRPFYEFSLVGLYMVNTMFDDHFTHFMT